MSEDPPQLYGNVLLYPAPLRLRWSNTLRERKWYWTWKDRRIQLSVWSFIIRLLLLLILFQSASYQNVALVFVVVQGPIVNHMTSSCPWVGQQVLHKVLPLCKVPHGSVLQHTPALIVAIHGPHLKEEGRETKALTALKRWILWKLINVMPKLFNYHLVAATGHNSVKSIRSHIKHSFFNISWDIYGTIGAAATYTAAAAGPRFSLIV